MGKLVMKNGKLVMKDFDEEQTKKIALFKTSKFKETNDESNQFVFEMHKVSYSNQ